MNIESEKNSRMFKLFSVGCRYFTLLVKSILKIKLDSLKHLSTFYHTILLRTYQIRLVLSVSRKQNTCAQWHTNILSDNTTHSTIGSIPLRERKRHLCDSIYIHNVYVSATLFSLQVWFLLPFCVGAFPLPLHHTHSLFHPHFPHGTLQFDSVLLSHHQLKIEPNNIITNLRLFLLSVSFSLFVGESGSTTHNRKRIQKTNGTNVP